jgi:hypothetical protein
VGAKIREIELSGRRLVQVETTDVHGCIARVEEDKRGVKSGKLLHRAERLLCDEA